MRKQFIRLGTYLYRFKWFKHWNRRRCLKCGHDQVRPGHRDFIDYQLCEATDHCARCGVVVYHFLYGYHENDTITRWEQIEAFIFGP